MHAARRGDTLYLQAEVDMQHVQETGTHRYRLVERCLWYLDRHKTERVTLKDLAEHVGVSEYHLHRVFTECAGITPDRFLRYLKKEVLLSRLADTRLLDLALDTGLGSSSRAHDLLVSYEAMSPGELRNRGEGVRIAYAFGDTPFGRSFIASTERGILSLRFVDADDDGALDHLAEEFPRAARGSIGYE
jgi:AraC family transcriptional regulator of adaptative response/methylated-DNA-[protein]-cysteine methyltransferase